LSCLLFQADILFNPVLALIGFAGKVNRENVKKSIASDFQPDSILRAFIGPIEMI
jgi:hypothetical protein